MIIINKEKCIGCGLCASDCVTLKLSIVDGKAAETGDRCILCGHCQAVCPEGAITCEFEGQSGLEGFDKDNCTVDADALQNFMAFRRSARQFKDKPVEKEKIQKILEAGRYTPTGSNKQNLSFIVLDESLAEIRSLAANICHEKIDVIGERVNPVTLNRIYETNKNGGDRLFFGAPIVIVVTDAKGPSIDGGLAASRMELIANAMGLGVCFNGIFAYAAEADPRINEKLGIGEDRKLVTTLMIGYPTVEYSSLPPRKDLSVKWM